MTNTRPKTLSQKIYDAHVVAARADGSDLLYIDRHYLHELSSAPAFAGIRARGRTVRRPDLTIATEDHIVSTRRSRLEVYEESSRELFQLLRSSCQEWDIVQLPIGHRDRGIVHIIGPELGLTLPGTTIVCGDSHTSTHGALGALAFGIGTSEVEHVLATQSLPQRRPLSAAVEFSGSMPFGTTAKDLILHTIGQIGTAAGVGAVFEYRGRAIRDLSIEERMTVCNMSIEAGARAGLVAPDQRTFDYLAGRPYAPKGAELEEAVAEWSRLQTDPGAVFDRTYAIDLGGLEPHVTWGTNPGQVAPISGRVPAPETFATPHEREAVQRALAYQGLEPGALIREVPVDAVFIGSCTNSRIDDLRAAAEVLAGRTLAPGVVGLVVPGSEGVRRAAEAEGLDRVFTDAGLEWGQPSCSMCAGMTSEVFPPGTRCVSTSNRNFEGRQGPGVRTHLASPPVAAASAVAGTIAAPGDLR